MAHQTYRKNGTSGALPLPSMDKLNELFIADFENGHLLWRDQSYPRKLGPAGSKNIISGHMSVTYLGQKLKVHRVIFALYHGYDPGDLVIDHINHDPADNRVENLRVCTLAQNTVSVRGSNKLNKSGYRGVYWSEGKKKWVASVPNGDNTKTEKAGFRCPTSAAVYAHRLRIEKHGEYCGGIR